MNVIKDYRGFDICLTDERKAHILEHPEMAAMEAAIQETLIKPQYVVHSRSDNEAQLYYRYYTKTAVGNKFLCVVVKFKVKGAFVLTAYLTDKIKKGEVIWSEKT